MNERKLTGGDAGRQQGKPNSKMFIWKNEKWSTKFLANNIFYIFFTSAAVCYGDEDPGAYIKKCKKIAFGLAENPHGNFSFPFPPPSPVCREIEFFSTLPSRSYPRSLNCNEWNLLIFRRDLFSFKTFSSSSSCPIFLLSFLLIYRESHGFLSNTWMWVNKCQTEMWVYGGLRYNFMWFYCYLGVRLIRWDGI